eukprot:TRINITY_DN5496_c0_g1_i1.p1 TRINITY_DN5496_c0_g1~~TRINITY_DN5496_c0_g1_i1.p1  ORF type:complete len:199 (+),score=29.65 TRINITY_DN5496_c0_g1_i1:74-670(+)
MNFSPLSSRWSHSPSPLPMMMIGLVLGGVGWLFAFVCVCVSVGFGLGGGVGVGAVVVWLLLVLLQAPLVWFAAAAYQWRWASGDIVGNTALLIATYTALSYLPPSLHLSLSGVSLFEGNMESISLFGFSLTLPFLLVAITVYGFYAAVAAVGMCDSDPGPYQPKVPFRTCLVVQFFLLGFVGLLRLPYLGDSSQWRFW